MTLLRHPLSACLRANQGINQHWELINMCQSSHQQRNLLMTTASNDFVVSSLDDTRVRCKPLLVTRFSMRSQLLYESVLLPCLSSTSLCIHIIQENIPRQKRSAARVRKPTLAVASSSSQTSSCDTSDHEQGIDHGGVMRPGNPAHQASAYLLQGAQHLGQSPRFLVSSPA